MEELIRQYGEMIIAMAGSMIFFAIIGKLFWCDDGMLLKMIYVWSIGGI